MSAQDTIFHNKYSLSCATKILDLSTPAVMGILNVTPDSFFDGGKYANPSDLMIQVKKMIVEGADIIDIGACSTRPGAKEISEEEELQRLIPTIASVRKEFPAIIISADTFRAAIARAAIGAGADMINDVSGGALDEKMYNTIAELNVPYIIMHMQGTPSTMQLNPSYENVTEEIQFFFRDKLQLLQEEGIQQVILDPGFGFGKNVQHNFELLAHLHSFQCFNLPILVGLSRKSLINYVLKTLPADALNGTTIVNTIALLNGANILRVHDVKQAKEAVNLVKFYQSLNQK